MKKITYLSIIIGLYALTCWGQTSDSISYDKISKDYFVRCLQYEKESLFPFSFINIADTANFKLYLPILLLGEASDTLLNYQRISPYIEKNFSPHNQRIFICNSNGIFTFSVIRGIYERLARNSLTPQILLSIPEKYMMGISDRNPNLVNRDFRHFPFSDKKITYERIQKYVDLNPDVQLFMIDKLPGIWGYKNGRLIKLIFGRKEVREMDGEAYYRNYLFPLSPEGIKRVIEGSSFEIVVVL